MDTRKLIIWGVVIVIVAVGVSYLVTPRIQSVTERITETQQVGGSGADFQTNWYRFGGVEHFASSMDMKTGTTTPCRLQGPSSTSTLIFASASFLTGSATAVVIDLAKTATSTSYASTTKIGQTYTLAANTSATIVASSTDSNGSAATFSPNEWFVVKMDNGLGGGGNSPKGECKAEWVVVDR